MAQICEFATHLIISLFCLANTALVRQGRQGEEVTKPLAFERLGDKGAAVEAAIFDPWGQVVVEFLSAL